MADSRSNTAESRKTVLVLSGLTGIALGILTGLSGSPVVGSVLTALLAVASAVIGALAGVELNVSRSESEQRSLKISIAPVAALVIGVAIGAMTGLYMRVNQVFLVDLPSKSLLIDEFQVDTLAEKYGIASSTVGQRLFDIDFSQPSPETQAPQAQSPSLINQLFGEFPQLPEND